MMRAKEAATPTMRKSPQKLLKLNLLKDLVDLESWQMVGFPIQLFSICAIFSPPVTFKIALDTSGTKGEPLANT